MALVPIYCWKLDKDGRPMVDPKGNKVPHPKQGQRKALRDWTPEERHTHDRQIKHFHALRRISAAQTLDSIRDAEKLMRD